MLTYRRSVAVTGRSHAAEMLNLDGSESDLVRRLSAMLTCCLASQAHLGIRMHCESAAEWKYVGAMCAHSVLCAGMPVSELVAFTS